MTVVLDASALIAYIRDEPGASVVEQAMEDWDERLGPAAVISASNWLEVAQRNPDRLLLEALSKVVQIIDVDRGLAESAAALWPETRKQGLSAADRICIALGQRRGDVVLTADRAWVKAAVEDAAITMIR